VGPLFRLKAAGLPGSGSALHVPRPDGLMLEVAPSLRARAADHRQTCGARLFCVTKLQNSPFYFLILIIWPMAALSHVLSIQAVFVC